MDWRLTGAVAGFLVLAGATAAWVSFLYQSPANGLIARKAPPTPTLIASNSARLPAAEAPRLSAPSLQAPQLPPPQASSEPVGADTTTGKNPFLPDPTPPPPPVLTAKPPPVHKHVASLSPPPEHPKLLPAPVLATPPPAPKKIVQEWKAVPTAKAGPFNLGGHIDHNGVVDSMASERLREALKQSKNYRRIPAEAKAWIEAPNINLSKLAPYRAMLGIDDRMIEAEQGVKFVRLFASTRGIDDEADLEADMAELPPGVAKSDIEPLVIPLIR